MQDAVAIARKENDVVFEVLTHLQQLVSYCIL